MRTCFTFAGSINPLTHIRARGQERGGRLCYDENSGDSRKASHFITLMSYSAPSIASLIDHTVLRPEATRADILQLCREALQNNFASVCVNAYWVPLVAAELAGSPVKVCTVVGFPLGATSTASKVAETEIAIKEGAQEIDMVQNVGALRGGDREAVQQDIEAVVKAAHRGNAIVKVILETALLDDDQKIAACQLAKAAGADFVKTSTGFGPAGATVHDIELMRRTVGPAMGVKASGGIRTLEDFNKMVAAGASRVGASASVKIVEAARSAQTVQSGT
jgi:deoxyribose-phosphate aldolase